MKSIKPVQAQIRRRGVVLSRDFLLQRLDVLSKGQPGQKYRAASMFAGLLAEQIAVEIGDSAGEVVAVTGSLQPGDRAAYRDSENLSEGASVKIMLSRSAGGTATTAAEG